jgi:phage tail tape-measure protein
MSKEGLKKFLIKLSKSKTERDMFRADPEGQMAKEDLTEDEKEACRHSLRAGNDLTAAHKRLAELQGGPPLGGDDNDAVVGEFLDRRKRKKPSKPSKPKKPAKRPAKKTPKKKK